MTIRLPLTRRSLRSLALALPCAIGLSAAAAVPHAAAQGTLRIAMTAADIPLTTGQPDNGFEGFRFIGFVIYDALIGWDLTSSDKPSTLIPNLATEWKVEDADKTKWIVKLRQGVKFHDGSTFNADSVIWNMDKLKNKDAPQYDPKQSAQGAPRMPALAAWKKIDDYTLELTTNQPDSTFPYQLSLIPMSSPANWEKQGKDWSKVALNPSGTGPWKATKVVARERIEFEPNKEYWNKTRTPKLDKLILMPVPEPSTRTSSLLSGQVDWIEAPAPDATDKITGAGFKIVSNIYPHYWPYQVSMVEGSPWVDARVRKAANLAIDREGLKKLLGGFMVPAKGFFPPNHPWYGHPTFDIKYDPAEAKKLLAEAGFSKDKPVTVKIAISASGSGQMQPLAMNEYIQQNWAEVGIKAEFEVTEWEALLGRWRAGAKADVNKNVNALNVSYSAFEPFTTFIRFFDSQLTAPRGANWGYYSDPEMDALFAKLRTTFDEKEQTAIIQKVSEKVVNESLMIFVAHDVAPRAMSAKVSNYVQPQNWFIDLTTISMK